jgi:hypothetical protein
VGFILKPHVTHEADARHQFYSFHPLSLVEMAEPLHTTLEGPPEYVIAHSHSYQGHTGRPSQKHQPYVFSKNIGLGFQLVGAAGCRLPPSSSHSSSSSQLKSQPCIFREYVGLMFLVTGAARVFGVPHVSLIGVGHQ